MILFEWCCLSVLPIWPVVYLAWFLLHTRLLRLVGLVSRIARQHALSGAETPRRPGRLTNRRVDQAPRKTANLPAG